MSSIRVAYANQLCLVAKIACAPHNLTLVWIMATELTTATARLMHANGETKELLQLPRGLSLLPNAQWKLLVQLLAIAANGATIVQHYPSGSEAPKTAFPCLHAKRPMRVVAAISDDTHRMYAITAPLHTVRGNRCNYCICLSRTIAGAGEAGSPRWWALNTMTLCAKLAVCTTCTTWYRKALRQHQP